MCGEYNIKNIELIKDLYFGNKWKERDGNQVHLKLIKKTTNDTDILMLVWHNDDIAEFARYLSNDGVPSLKKWALVVLSFPSDYSWDDIVPGELSLLYYITPQFLKLEALV
jgi:phosphohistidine phosphatase SixA